MKSNNSSFSAKLKSGWSKERLMEYYALNDAEYNKIIKSLSKIHSLKSMDWYYASH